MAFQRVILTAQELRDYKPIFPELKPHPLQSALDKARSSSHVTPVFAFSVAIDLMGLDLSLMFVREAPAVLNSWIALLEHHGWGNEVKPLDLQINMILNAIKITAQSTGLTHLKLEERAYDLIKAVARENNVLEHSLIQSLILNKALNVTWTVATHLPEGSQSSGFGEWKKQ